LQQPAAKALRGSGLSHRHRNMAVHGAVCRERRLLMHTVCDRTQCDTSVFCVVFQGRLVSSAQASSAADAPCMSHPASHHVRITRFGPAASCPPR
jgi:hypothetical protein